MDIIRRIRRFGFAGLMVLVLLVTGCGYLESTEMRDYTAESDLVFFKNSTHPSLYQLFGDITGNELRTLAQDILDNLQSASRYGDLSHQDGVLVHESFIQLRDYVAGLEDNNSDAQETLGEIFLLMSEYHVGDILTSLFSAMAVDGAETYLLNDNPDDDYKANMLTQNLLPMLEYIVNMDFGDFEGFELAASDAVQDAAITTEDINKLKTVLANIMDKDGAYADVYTQSKTLFDLAKAREAEKAVDDMLTVGDLKELINKITGGMSIDDLSSFDFKPVVDAFRELWEEQNGVLHEDSIDMLYALGRLLADTTRPGYDGWGWTNVEGMTDMERILLCIQDILNPVIQDRGVLQDFLLNTVDGVALLEGADNIHGILEGLSTVNQNDMMEIDTALYQYLLQNNINGDSRGTTDINVSVARGVIYLLSSLYSVSTIDAVENLTPTLLSLIVAENSSDIPKQNILEWMLGLMIVGMYEYPEDYNYIEGYTDPLEGLDWVFYEQDLNIQIEVFGYPFTLMSLDGLYGALGILLEHDALLNTVNAVIGGLTDPLPSLIEFVGSTGEKYSTGEKHKLFAIVAPLLKHYYDQGRILDVVEMASYINEIDPYEYVKLYGNGMDATFRRGTTTENRLGHVFENIEGLNGYGLMYYGLRGDNAADDDNTGDLLDPILDMLVRVLHKLETTSYGTGSLLDHVTTFGDGDSADGGGMSGLDVINAMFESDLSGKSSIDKVYDFLVNNHNELTSVSQVIGNIILTLHSELTSGEFDNVFDVLVNGSVLTVLQEELSKEEGQQALETVVRSVLEIVFEITEEDLNDGVMTNDEELVNNIVGLLDAVLKASDTLISDIKTILPIIANQFENLSTADSDTESVTEGFTKILDTFLDEIGKQSTLTDKLKIMAFKALYVNNGTYNKDGVITDDTYLFDALDFLLTGENPKYNLMPLFDFFNAAKEKDLIGDFLSDGTRKESTILRNIQEEEDVEMFLSMGFIRALFTPYDGRDSIMELMFSAMHIQRVEDGEMKTLDVNLLIEDMAGLINEFNLDPETNPRLYKTVLDLLNLFADEMVVL